MTTPRLSVIVPVLNEAQRLPGLLEALQPWRGQGVELIMVDGGSCDESRSLATGRVDALLQTESGRARQMNAGAARARSPMLWFLHADSLVDDNHLRALLELPAEAAWGRFDVRFAAARHLRPVALGMNWRSRLTGIATGDQGIFVRRDLFDGVGGYPDQPLMEDVALCARLRRHGRPYCLARTLVIDDRRWRVHGALKTVLLMWSLRFLYWLGVDPQRLHRVYYRHE